MSDARFIFAIVAILGIMAGYYQRWDIVTTIIGGGLALLRGNHATEGDKK